MMNRNVMGVSGVRALLLIWGFGIAVIIAMILAADVWIALCSPAAQQQKTAEPKTIRFPCRVADTSLTVEYVAAYDGAFVEDGCDREVTGVAAAMLRNCSDSEIGEAYVSLRSGEALLQFYAQSIPPGARVLVLEKNAAHYTHAEYESCNGEITEKTEHILLPQELRIEEIAMGTLQVTNLTQLPMEGITLFYKTRSPDGAFYIGGITYQTEIPILEPAQSVNITPYHYAAGYSAVTKVTKPPLQ